MIEEDSREPKVHEISLGDAVRVTDSLVAHSSGADSEGVRLVDGRGWKASGDTQGGAMSAVSASGLPSENEDLTEETCRILVRRLNQEGATWGDPVELDQRTGSGVDAESRDTRDPRRRLQLQVVRGETDGEFWSRLRRHARSDLPPATAVEAAERLWTAIQRKHLHAHRDVVLALNAIRTPWLALRPIVQAFRARYGADARGIGFAEVWIVGPTETLTARLDTAQ